MTIAALGIVTQTDASGWYLFTKVPTGTHQITVVDDEVSARAATVADLDAYRVIIGGGTLQLTHNGKIVPFDELQKIAPTGGVSGPTHRGVQVTVKPNAMVTADPIVLLPNDSFITNAVIHQAYPDPDKPIVNDGMTPVLFSFDTVYTLQAQKGYLLVVLYSETGNTLAYWLTELTGPGGGERVFSDAVPLEHCRYIFAQALVLNDTYAVLAASRAGRYYLINAVEPSAPVLFAEKDGLAVKLTWKYGNLSGFQRIEIVRNTELIATITDPAVTTYIDRFPQEAQSSNSYRLRFYTELKTAPLPSNTVTVDIPIIGISPVPNFLNVNDLVTDPVRDVAYVAHHSSRNIISKLLFSGELLATTEVCAIPDRMSVSQNGDTLAVACPGSSTVALVDLNTFTVKKMLRDIKDLRDLAFSPSGDRLYLALGTYGLQYYDVATDTIIKPGNDATNLTNGVFVGEDDGKIIANGSTIRVLRTDDFTSVVTIPNPNSTRMVFVDHKRGRLYLNKDEYDLETGALIGNVDFTIYDLTPDSTL